MMDLNKCKRGDKLLTSQGLILTYVVKLPKEHYYDHAVKYPDGAIGGRTDDGHVYRGMRLPSVDQDIIKIL